MLAQNVVKFENENMKVYNYIQSYFKSLNDKNRDYTEKDNTKTQQAYESDIRLFFHLMRGKEKKAELEYLTMDDLNISQDDFEEFIEILCDLKDEKGSNKYVNKTINRKTVALKSFIKFMKKKKIIDIDISYLELIKGKTERKVHYGALEVHEVMQMSELALKERNKKQEKHFLILFAFKTGLRKAEILNLKWTDFLEKEDRVMINGLGKGNKEFENVSISKDFYNELLTLRNSNEFVFQLSGRRLNDLMDRLKEQLNISPDRCVVFHSIRKAFGTHIYRTTRDINAARIALRHSSILTTQIYLGAEDNQIHHSIFEVEKLDDELYTKVSEDVLKEAISKCSKSTQLMINLQLQELLKQNK